MNLKEIESLMEGLHKVGKQLIDHWHKRKLEQERIKSCRKALPK